MNFKSKKFLIPVISLLIIGAGFGTFLGRYYFTAKNLEIDIEKMDILSIKSSGTFLNPGYDIEIDLHGTIKSITSIDISVEFVSYSMKIDGKNFGPGVVDGFNASKTPSPLIIHHNAENIGLNDYSIILNFILGVNITVEITLLTVTMMGITFDLNSITHFVINIDDL